MPTKSTASQIVKIFVQKVLAKVSQPGKKKKNENYSNSGHDTAVKYVNFA